MVVVGILTGCTSAPTPPVQTQNPAVVFDFTAAAQPVKPVVVQIPVGGELQLSFDGPDTIYLQPTNWIASISDPTILTFSPANGSGRAASLPLFTAVKQGHTTAVLTYTHPNPPQQVTFDVTVTGP